MKHFWPERLNWDAIVERLDQVATDDPPLDIPPTPRRTPSGRHRTLERHRTTSTPRISSSGHLCLDRRVLAPAPEPVHGPRTAITAEQRRTDCNHHRADIRGRRVARVAQPHAAGLLHGRRCRRSSVMARSASAGRFGGSTCPRCCAATRLRQKPELSGEPQAVEDRLILVARARLPLRRQPVAPPSWASSLRVVTGIVTPGGRLPSQAWMCSSDRKRFIVLQVKRCRPTSARRARGSGREGSGRTGADRARRPPATPRSPGRRSRYARRRAARRTPRTHPRRSSHTTTARVRTRDTRSGRLRTGWPSGSQ